MTDDDNSFKLIDDVSDYVSTDIIVDLKSGIYNLFVSLVEITNLFIFKFCFKVINANVVNYLEKYKYIMNFFPSLYLNL